MRIIATSDNHGRLLGAQIPKGDVLVLAGDVLPNFTRDRKLDALRQEAPLLELDEYLGKQGFKKIIFVAGNHDWLCERHKEALKGLKHMTYLQDQELVVDGVKFYGSPWQPEFYDWAFNLPRNGERLKHYWNNIPSNTDVLVTHSPPWGYLDQIDPSGNPLDRDTEHLGCELLATRVREIKPKVHVFGHIHGSYGKRKYGDTLFVNASMCDENYYPGNRPHVIELETRSTSDDKAASSNA